MILQTSDSLGNDFDGSYLLKYNTKLRDGYEKIPHYYNDFIKDNLKVSEIMEAFPEECIELIPKLINKLSSELDSYKQEEHQVKYYTTDQVLRAFKIGCLEINKPKDKFNHMKKITVISKMMKSKNNPNGWINDVDISNAKEVKIDTLHSFNKVKKFGNKITACCPFHKDDTPSFLINSNNTFKCFSCNEFGDSIKFIQLLNNLKFIDAVKFINERN